MEMKKTNGIIILTVLMLALLPSLAFAVACGDTIMSDTTLTSSLNCPNKGLIMGADNIVLDCAGNAIYYASAASGYGVDASNRNNVTIKNCVFYMGPNLANSYGVYFSNTRNSAILNNTLTTNYGVQLILLDSGSNNNDIKNNRISGQGAGIWLLHSQSYNRIESNQINASGEGIRIQDAANYNNIISNDIRVSGQGAKGIAVLYQPSYNNISSNNITGTSSTGSIGIWFYYNGQPNYNTISGIRYRTLKEGSH